MPAPVRNDVVLTAMRRLRTTTALPVIFSAEVSGETAELNRFIGTTTDAMTNLTVTKGRGLGGHVMASGHLATVRDYRDCEVITRDYQEAVQREGLRAIISAPVTVAGATRVILYGSARVASHVGDQVSKSFVSIAAELAAAIQARDETQRLLRTGEQAVAEKSHGLEAVDREQLRVLHGELRAIAAELADPGVRKRLLAATSALAGVVHSPGEPVRPVGPECSLSAREIDVLAQVALGLSNAEVATRLTLSPETIKAYLRNIAAKLGTRSRMESVMRARLLGVLP